MRIDWFQQASPERVFPLAGKLIPWFASASFAFCALGLYIGFFVAPSDVLRGDAHRIVFLHVPAAWLSLFLFLMMAGWAAAGLALNMRVPSMMASALAPTGAMFSFLALWTGALWGRPTWGSWWAWDARLTSELILLLLYVAFMGVQELIEEPRRADKAGAVLALAGAVGVPAIYFSLQWWGASHGIVWVGLRGPSDMETVMLAGMLVTAVGFWTYSVTASLLRIRCILLERERHAEWAGQYAEGMS